MYHGIRLIEVPLARLSQTLLSQLLDTNTSARELIHSQKELVEAEERAPCKQVVDAATPRQRAVLEAFAKGLHPQAVAEQLYISNTTVSAHTNVLLDLCHNAWPPREKERRDYRFLQLKFAGYFR
jgi:CRISPR-associated protein Csx14